MFCCYLLLSRDSHIFKAHLVLFPIIRCWRLVWKRDRGELVFVVGVFQVLDIFEDGIESFHSLRIEKTDFCDKFLTSLTSDQATQGGLVVYSLPHYAQ